VLGFAQTRSNARCLPFWVADQSSRLSEKTTTGSPSRASSRSGDIPGGERVGPMPRCRDGSSRSGRGRPVTRTPLQARAGGLGGVPVPPGVATERPPTSVSSNCGQYFSPARPRNRPPRPSTANMPWPRSSHSCSLSRRRSSAAGRSSRRMNRVTSGSSRRRIHRCPPVREGAAASARSRLPQRNAGARRRGLRRFLNGPRVT
jgi:hypothetical protein